MQLTEQTDSSQVLEKNSIARNLHSYWFGEQVLTPDLAQSRNGLWFSAAAETGLDIERRFGKLVSLARQHGLDYWQQDSHGKLVLLLLLDQFPRSLYRGQASAFASDQQALAITMAAIKEQDLDNLNIVEMAFLLMPCQHAEDIGAQNLGVELLTELEKKAPQRWRPTANNFLTLAREHQAIIQRFGRFPHRNKLLSRASSAEELKYLKQSVQHFG